METKKINPAVTVIKFLAIFSVVCAHCSGIGGSSIPFAVISSRILENFGTFGVGCFYILAGALYNPRKYTFSALVKNKLINLGIPWIISATAVYLYVVLRKPPMSFVGWLQYVAGYNTYCYYLSVLFVLFILFYIPFMQNDIAGYICMGLSTVCVLVYYDKGFLTPYLDITNWMGYFALGMIIGRHRENFEKKFVKLMPVRWIAYAVCVVLAVFQIYSDRSGYMGTINGITAFSGVLALMLCGTALSKKKLWPVIETVGNNTLFIYLWHMPLAGIVANLGSRGVAVYTVVLRPFLIIAIMALAVWAVRKTGKRVCSLLGVR